MLNSILNLFKKDYLRKWQVIVSEINSLEEKFESLETEKLKDKTQEFKERLSKGETLDDLLPEAFALVREAAKRTLNQRHYDVQLLGGICLHKGMVVEMMTGEGKTLTATLAAYLNSLTGDGVHICTVNDYLAKRDTAWMGQIYNLLGISVSCIVHEQSFIYDPYFVREEKDKFRDTQGNFMVFYDYLKPIDRKTAYQADIIYGTNHEFGFDYLKDNLSIDKFEVVQRGFNYAIVDEVDSILIDESRTPLIISGFQSEANEIYYLFDKIAKTLKSGIDFNIDKKRKVIYLTEEGQDKVAKILGYDPYKIENLHAIHHLEQALKANYIFFRDKDYIVKDNQIIIVDEFTGRLMWGRRWSGGLHQAIEAKEGVSIQPESKTIAQITIQNFFRKYKKLSGMTGTAITSAEEFYKVYGLETIFIPPNKKCIRIDHPDKIFINQKAKWDAIVNKIEELHKVGRPVLVGTTSIEKNEFLSKKLREKNIPHQILNAKNHEEEGKIIAQAGKLGMVTVATNMAGRGVDIILGGNPSDYDETQKIKELGGLFVIGTERHEARRIDNQLRGRAGRQGDPGETQFFVSLEDDLIKIFGGEKIKSILIRLNIKEEVIIEHPLISKAIEEAQNKIEGFNFDLRKHLLEYDDVINSQRDKIYSDRRKILFDEINSLEFLSNSFEEFLKEDEEIIKFHLKIRENILSKDELIKEARDIFFKKYSILSKLENFRELIKIIILKTFDYLWTEHLSYLEELKETVSWRGYAQKDPLVEYKREALNSFNNFYRLVNINLISNFMNLEIRYEEPKIDRNTPCPCGSGKKWKKCGLLNTEEHQQRMKMIKNF
ncbi:MAG: protein translocase subunit SecA [Candidatus Parcubacteria bacterium]|nr:MAG: protein translocase subunit SecA [Candidatus Parcubacteria bacterium]